MKLVLAKSQDVLVLTYISKRAFDSDIEVGGTQVGGPPGYQSQKYHFTMAAQKHLYTFYNNGLIVGGAILFKDGTNLYIRPLAKLSQAVKITNTSDQRKAESKAFSTIAIAFREDTKPFEKTDGMFHKDTFS